MDNTNNMYTDPPTHTPTTPNMGGQVCVGIPLQRATCLAIEPGNATCLALCVNNATCLTTELGNVIESHIKGNPSVFRNLFKVPSRGNFIF